MKSTGAKTYRSAFFRRSKRSTEAEYVIRRSLLGLLSIRFKGGCSYPDMVDALYATYKRTGFLIRCGEALSAQNWLSRIAQNGYDLSEVERASILTLMGEALTKP